MKDGRKSKRVLCVHEKEDETAWKYLFVDALVEVERRCTLMLYSKLRISLSVDRSVVVVLLRPLKGKRSSPYSHHFLSVALLVLISTVLKNGKA